MTRQYILKGKKVVPEDDTLKWSKWYEQSHKERRVGLTKIGDTEVSTVFLGLDHNFFDEFHPLVFETMVFGGPKDGYQDRCSTWDEAVDMHERMVALIRELTE